MVVEIKVIMKEENIIKHNKHILAVSGGEFGILNKGNLDFAINSINAEKNVINQATNALYYLTINHPFLEGNKRTAFELAKGILLSGGNSLVIPDTEIINFITGSVAQNKVSKEETRHWLISHIISSDEKGELNTIVKKNIEDDKELLKKLD